MIWFKNHVVKYHIEYMFGIVGVVVFASVLSATKGK